jgi:hypothetical protein
MARLKNIRIKKRGGGFRVQRVRVLRSGKFRFVKNTGRKTSRSRKRVSRRATTKRRTFKVARRRRVVRRRKSSMSGMTKLALGGALYGIAREPLNSLASRIPLIGGIGDEAGLLLASWVMATKTKGIARQVGRAGVVIEAHNLARNLSGGALNLFGGAQQVVSTEQSFR